MEVSLPPSPPRLGPPTQDKCIRRQFFTFARMTSIASATTLQDLDTNLRAKIDVLQVCADLRGGWAEDTVGEVEQQARELEALKKDIALYRSTIASARQELSSSCALLKQMQQLSLRLLHIKEYMPQRVPRPAPQQQKTRSKKSPSEEDAAPISQPKPQPPAKPAVQKSKRLPTVEFVTMEEFNSVPKYIRGRIQYAQVNTAVEEVNKALEAKYTLLSRPRAKLSEMSMKIVSECRRQVNEETKGLFFVVDNDIKRWSSLKMDTAGKSLLTMLRTLKRLREVRGPGSLVRYAVLV